MRVLAGVLSEPRLGVKAVDLRDAPIHIKKDHAGCPGRVMERIDHSAGGPGGVAVQQGGSGDATKATGGLLQQAAAGERQRAVTIAVMGGRHGLFSVIADRRFLGAVTRFSDVVSDAPGRCPCHLAGRSLRSS